MSTGESRELPVCRVGMSEADLARQADRSALYGAILAAQRPGVRLKPHVALAAEALVPAVRAYLAGEDGELAEFALAYARACGGEAFLMGKRRGG